MDNEKSALDQIAEACGGRITEINGPLSDGSGFALMSMPLPKTHWIYRKGPDGFGLPSPMPFRMGSGDEAALLIRLKRVDGQFVAVPVIEMTKRDFAERIRDAGRYAIRASTWHGADMDFDPDAMLQNLVVGFLGLNTIDGFGEDFDNPEGGGRENWKARESADYPYNPTCATPTEPPAGE